MKFKSFIDRRVTICMLLVALTLLGYFSYKQLPVELLPNTELPQLYVTCSSRSDLTPSYMEQQVVIPLEGAISAVGGVENMESTAYIPPATPAIAPAPRPPSQLSVASASRSSSSIPA